MSINSRLLMHSALLALATGLAVNATAAAQNAPIVQPGAPGEDVRAISAEEAVEIAANRFSVDDVRFMQDMIVHHYQAVEMAELVSDRTSTEEIVAVAGRINASQADEIAFMQNWLNERGQHAPDPASADHSMDHEGGHEGHHGAHATMQGMATPEQMAELAASNGGDFDALFLELMIAHHEGAVDMVDALLRQRGSAYDPVLYDFVNDVRSEQAAEIRRMNTVLSSLSEDPRNGLAAGFRDAGQAISNLELLASLPKPTGFFDSENPAGLPPEIQPEDTDEEVERRFGQRAPFLSFSNTDMAFAGDLLAVGNYHGFNLYRLGDESPELISSVVCPGGQGDVSIVGDLLLMSVQDTRARVDCGRQGVSEEVSEERFRGLRIFDISNPLAPRQVGQVQTCRGSHTHSVVSSNEERIVVYNSGTSSIRSEEELAGCVEGLPGDEDTALFSIDVIEIPLSDPSQSRIVDSPRVFADDETGRIAGLWSGGDHGEGTQRTSRTDQCHDITVFPSLNLAAGACSGNGIILDISDPRAPRRIDAVIDQGFAYWHSATFSNDGTKVLFTDEWGGGGRPRCRAQDPADWGADAIYTINDGQLEFGGYYKLPSAQSEEENCVAHNGSIIPVPGRDVFVQAWYQGGLSILDFTDPANAYEIAYFDRGPIDPDVMVLGGYWSTYWYDGRIYGTEIVRGLDVFELMPSDYLSENEIAAARLADQGQTFNPQQQYPVSWPEHPVVGLAYLDQLMRDEALPAEQAEALYAALGQAADAVDAGEDNAALSRELRQLRRDLSGVSVQGEASVRRLSALQDVIEGVSASLR
ncbi:MULTISPECIES: DUF305 domain-containing protein [unclassified Oceanicaulis]|uniref:DUF305 domain-containing protein n=1 Tax=unclassified Oceanicaulis TaxID=2632123 RepID=UPI0025D19AD8|nr:MULTISPECIES: DUF305 domain-containing protein [unclassified Oceanicaulis]|tara:strand:- start:4330 stop:6768 length:2439 start_codon:yes stop_codon:yes gene_type:complete